LSVTNTSGDEAGRGGANGGAMHESFLVHRRFKWLKRALVLCLIAIALYAFTDFQPKHNGGTWLGYGLGTLGLVLILWLTWLGVKKRRYSSGNWSLKGWTSAHVYLGLALIVIVTLHSGFQFGWNVHTLAYALMMVVIASGIFGIVAYARYPVLMSENRRSMTRDQMLRQIAEQDVNACEAALELDDRFVTATRAAVKTRITGGFMSQLRNRCPKCETASAMATIHTLQDDVPPEQRGALERVLVALKRKQDVLSRLRRDIQLKALMDIWLYFHVPVALALIAALAVHIITVFIYW